ncbi:uracil-DNA glycosylase [Paenibacillus selenitireducens]|uniref:Uracil-DNA glycosylase n=1 Tax=Paenibacillus selenitireducens TaxID=1324314 RepID=A0A1T2XFQ6_9BACL|nr:uracil-DNA glycosylase [Paenibacillus selenitireducens]OPA78516.1 uracil-DNA glycosylase [Paenibacillus selenitireducens]
MPLTLPQDWNTQLAGELEQPYMQKLLEWLEGEYANETIYPPRSHIFEAFARTSYTNTRVVILGQDPYHGANQAHGLSFSVQPGVRIPPSLRNIYKELNSDLNYDIPEHGTLTSWADQGVLLLNTVLTVRSGVAFSHQRQGWEAFTDAVIHALNQREQPLVFMLWGNHAQQKAASLDPDRHCIISSAHPSPLSARKGFFGSRPFSRTNEFLRQKGMETIDWNLAKYENFATINGDCNDSVLREHQG